MDWTDLSPNPVDPAVHRLQLEQLRSAKRVDLALGYRDFLVARIRGRAVLDIGMVEHDDVHMARAGWMHDAVCEHAARALGIDIVEAGIAGLARRGYNVRVADATSDEDLAERFDIVVIGDVIEHVDNPVALLRFAARHLLVGGQVIVKTPNPWFYRYVIRNAKEGVFIANAEHISWVTPSLALEIGRRTRLALSEYWLLRGSSASRLKRPLRFVPDRLLRGSEFLSPDFTYVYRPLEDAPSPRSLKARQ